MTWLRIEGLSATVGTLRVACVVDALNLLYKAIQMV